jgi:hypothetical protein
MLLLLANAANVVCSLCYILFYWSCKLLLLLDFLHVADVDGVACAGGQRRFDRGQFFMWLYLDRATAPPPPRGGSPQVNAEGVSPPESNGGDEHRRHEPTRGGRHAGPHPAAS